jgi:hypothetical protein
MSVAELRALKFKWEGNLKDSQRKKTARRKQIYVAKQ